MRFLVYAALLAVACPLAGCADRTAPPPPPTNRPAVDIHTPNVDVKAGNGETNVRAPGANVDVEKK